MPPEGYIAVTARDLLSALRDAEADRDREATARAVWKAKARAERKAKLEALAAFDACYEELVALRRRLDRRRRVVRLAVRTVRGRN